MNCLRRFAECLLVIGLLTACDGNSAETPVKAGPLQAGAGEALIDLPVGHSTAGYMQTRELAFEFPEDEPGSPFADLFPASRGTVAPPKAKALLLDNRAERLAIVRIDAIFSTDVLVERIVTLAQAELGLNLRGRLLLSATHTHAGGARFATSMRVKLLDHLEGWRQDAVGHGVDSFNPESVDRLARSAVAALRQARESLGPAALGYARGERTDATRDRRCVDNEMYGEGNIDQAVRLVRIDRVNEEGQSSGALAVLVNFAMHGTVFGGHNHRLSVDAPGYLEKKLEERFDSPVTVMFLQGTAGDVAPGGEGRGTQRMEDAGYRVAEEAFRLFRAVTGAVEAEAVEPLSTEVPLQVKTRRIPLNHALLGYETGEFYPDGGMLCQMANQSCPARKATPTGVSCLGVAHEGEGKYHTDIAAARVGPLTLLTIPGEPVSEVGRRLHAHAEELGLGETLLLGYAQDHNGYILMPDDWLSGGYEPTISYWGWKFAPWLIEQEADLLRELHTGKAAAKQVPPRVQLPPIEYEPVAATASSQVPAVYGEPATWYSRFEAVDVAFSGGDPALGLPIATVERKVGDAWQSLNFRDWRAVSNAGLDMATDYEASPTYLENPEATVRDHRWQVRWDIPAWVPKGDYRMRISGTALASGTSESEGYELLTRTFRVEPSAALSTHNGYDSDGNGTLDAAGDFFQVVENAGKLDIRVTAFFPQQAPEWDERGEHQIGNFRLYSERGTPAYSHAGRLTGTVVIEHAGVAIDTLTLGWVDDGSTDKLSALAPDSNELPRLEGVFDIPGEATGNLTVRFATGDIADSWGNQVPGRTVEIIRP